MESDDGHGAIRGAMTGGRQSVRFLALYALAAAGGSVSYAPFLSLLFPARVAAEWGDQGLQVLSLTAFLGAISASLANIAFGWLSDRTGGRRGWIFAGVILSGILLVAIQMVQDLTAIIAMIVIWQVALNMMLAPLAAWAGDCVPHEQKGTLGGLLSMSPAMGAVMGAIATVPGFLSVEMRPAFIAACVAVMVLPVVLLGRPRPMPHLMIDLPEDERMSDGHSHTQVVRMWIARLLVQIAEAALFAFQLFWFRSIAEDFTENDTALVFVLVLSGSVPMALLAGRWSDRIRRPVLPLEIAAGCSAVGLLFMGLSADIMSGVISYVFFGISSGVFLALHSSQTLRVLPRPSTRGRDLGLFNLTNTVPSLIMPWLALALVPVFGFDALFLVLGGLCALACLLLLTMRRL